MLFLNLHSGGTWKFTILDFHNRIFPWDIFEILSEQYMYNLSSNFLKRIFQFFAKYNMFNFALFLRKLKASLIWREILNGCKNDLKCTKLFIAIRCYREITETPSDPCSKTSFLRFYYSTNIWSIYSIDLFNAISNLMPWHLRTFAICRKLSEN